MQFKCSSVSAVMHPAPVSQNRKYEKHLGLNDVYPPPTLGYVVCFVAWLLNNLNISLERGMPIFSSSVALPNWKEQFVHLIY